MVGLMDCNNFFVSCERLFRPDLKHKPVFVLSSNDGCVVSRSQEVKDLGIPMGIPYFEIRDICKKHTISVFSSNFTLYRDISARVMEVLKDEFGRIEVYSIDEAFIAIPETMTVKDVELARARIIQKTGIPVSFGIAPSKTMAKIANAEAKKGKGVVWLTLDEAQHHYGEIPCGSVWGIGRQISQRLYSLQIRTVSDFLEKGRSFARQEFGVHGERLYLELSGIRTDGSAEETIQGSIMSTRSFEHKITDKETLFSAVGYHVVQVGEKLRDKGLMAGTLRVMCAPSRFDAHVAQITAVRVLELPTYDTTTLLKIASELVNELYRPDILYKKAGVIVSSLVPGEYVSPSLFEGKKFETIYSTIDAINDRFGRGTVKPAVSHSTAFASRSYARSPEYTTQWEDIAIVKT